MPLVAEDASWRERLFSMIGSEDGRLEPLYPPVARRPGAGRQRSGHQSGLPADHEYVACRDRVAIIEQGLASGELMPRRLVIIVARRGWSLRMSHYLAAILLKISAIRCQTAATRRWRSRRDRRDSLKLCNICRWGSVLRSITAARICPRASVS